MLLNQGLLLHFSTSAVFAHGHHIARHGDGLRTRFTSRHQLQLASDRLLT